MIDERIKRQLNVLSQYIKEDGAPCPSVSSAMALQAVSVIEELLIESSGDPRQAHKSDPRQSKPL